MHTQRMAMCTWSWRTSRTKPRPLRETTNGSLVLAVPSDMQADVEARCLNGNFSSELPITMESNQRPREMHGKLAAAALRFICAP